MLEQCVTLNRKDANDIDLRIIRKIWLNNVEKKSWNASVCHVVFTTDPSGVLAGNLASPWLAIAGLPTPAPRYLFPVCGVFLMGCPRC